MAVAVCPSCHGQFPRGPEHCPHCNHDLAKWEPAAHEEEVAPRKELPGPTSDLNGASIIGAAFLLIGFLAAAYAIYADVSVGTGSLPGDLGISIPDRVVNLDALFKREMVFNGGIASMLIGAILVAAGQILAALEDIRRSL